MNTQLKYISDFLGFTNSKLTVNNPKGPESNGTQDPNAPVGEKQVFLEWSAVSRPPKRDTDTKMTRTFIIIGVVFALLLVIMQEFFIILIILGIIFFRYVISQTPPETLHYELSNYGIQVGDNFYYWSQFKEFYFTKAGDLDVLAVVTQIGIPAAVFLTVLPENKEKVKEILNKYLVFLAAEPKSFVDKISESIMQKFMLREEPAAKTEDQK